VPGPKGARDLAVVLAALIKIADQKRDRRAGRPAFEDAGKNLDLIGFAPLCDMARGAGLPAIQLELDVRGREFEPWRTAIDDAADGRPMRFAERSDGKQRAEGVAGHQESGIRNQGSATV
jgi:hypothetical protein